MTLLFPEKLETVKNMMDVGETLYLSDKKSWEKAYVIIINWSLSVVPEIFMQYLIRTGKVDVLKWIFLGPTPSH